MRAPRGLARVAVAVTLTVVAAFVGTASARADDLDLTSLRDRVAGQLTALPPGSPGRSEYRRLANVLAKRDRAGLTDDFQKLGRVARALRQKLGDDLVLSGALGDALTVGAAALTDAEVAAALAVADNTSERARRRGDSAVLRGRDLDLDARRAAMSADNERSCRLWARAAAVFLRAARAAERSIAGAARHPARWQTVIQNGAAELLSIYVSRGASPEVYVVGGFDEFGPTFLRGGTEGFARIPVGGTGDLWWVTPVPGDGMWAVGDDGRAVRYDPETGELTDHSTGLAATLYGVWGSGPTDIWAVGVGLPSAGLSPTLVHWDGATWTMASVPAEIRGAALYKVIGRGADDVYACGTHGILIHFDGVSWSTVPSNSERDLLTVTLGGKDLSAAVAVGSVLSAEIVERDGAGAWAPVPIPPDTKSVAGVYVPEQGDAFACGYFATVLRRVNGRWRSVPGVPFDPSDDVHLHAVSVDDDGGAWIVGGDIFGGGKGTLLYFGPREIREDAGLIVPQARWTTTVHPLLYASCAFTACHVPPLLGASLDMETPESAAAALPRVPSAQSGLLRVAPRLPSRSYLWHKLSGTQGSVGGSGSEMPQDRLLTTQQRNQIRAWILEGALTR